MIMVVPEVRLSNSVGIKRKAKRRPRKTCMRSSCGEERSDGKTHCDLAKSTRSETCCHVNPTSADADKGHIWLHAKGLDCRANLKILRPLTCQWYLAVRQGQLPNRPQPPQSATLWERLISCLHTLEKHSKGIRLPHCARHRV